MRTASVTLIELEKFCGAAQPGKDRPENTISVIRAPGSRSNALLGLPGIRPDAESYLHFSRPVDLTLLSKRDIHNARRILAPPPEYIAAIPADLATRSNKPHGANPASKDVPSRPRVDQIGHDLPPAGPLHPVIEGYQPVKTEGPQKPDQRKSTATLLEEALKTLPTMEAHELLLQREIAACRNGNKRMQPVSGQPSSGHRRGPAIDR
jgi:hypothetical protein